MSRLQINRYLLAILVGTTHIVGMLALHGLGSEFPFVTLALVIAIWVIALRSKRKWLYLLSCTSSLLFFVALERLVKLP